MKYEYNLMLARVFMGYPCEGDHECVVCGLTDRADRLLKRSLKPTFVNFDEIMLGSSEYICESCEALINDPDMRFKAVYYPASGDKLLPARPDILEIIKNPTDEWVLSVPYSNKKHHWLYAGLSDKHTAYIGTDNRTVMLDYDKMDVPHIIEIVQTLIKGGVPRAEIIAGRYSTATRYKVPDIEDYEAKIGEYRAGGAIELFARYTPAIKNNEKVKLECKKIMLTENEKMAARVLYDVASRSQIRANNGLTFWNGFFERRVNRLKNLPLHEFVSKLSDAIGSAQVCVSLLDDINNDEEIMDEIRRKTALIVSLAFTINKERKNTDIFKED